MNLELITACHTVVLDLDGVVYRGTQLIEGADVGIRYLSKLGKEIKFLTNSSSKGAVDIANKLNKLGIDCHATQVMTSAMASALYLSEHNYNNIYVIGETGLKKELYNKGLSVVDQPRHADALLVGLDTNISYKKISDAIVCIQAGCHFVACNRDPSYPADRNTILPGCGPIIAAVESASEKCADFVAGKPSRYILDKLMNSEKIASRHIVVVGDSLESDIRLAIDYGAVAVHINDQIKDQTIEKTQRQYFSFKSVLELGQAVTQITSCQ